MSENPSRGRALRVPLRTLVMAALLLAMYVVLDRFVSIKTAGWKIGFAFIAPAVAAILFGPLWSMLVYALGDLIGALLFPFGPYHPGFTVCAALMGALLGLFLNRTPLKSFGSDFAWQRIRLFPNIVLPVVVNCLLLGLVVNTLWVSQLYGSRTYGGWLVYRLPEYAVLVPVQLVLLPILLRLCPLLRRDGRQTARVEPPHTFDKEDNLP